MSEDIGQRPPLTVDLSRRNPDLFKQALLLKLASKHPLALQAWDLLVNNNRSSIDAVQLDPTTWISHSISGQRINLGTASITSELKSKIYFEDSTFSYQDETLYRFSHEASHKLVAMFSSQLPQVNQLFNTLRDMRKHQSNKGMSALGSLDFYKNHGPETQAKEDITELVNMYLWDPAYLKRYLDFLSAPAHATTRERLGLITLKDSVKQTMFQTIKQIVEVGLQK